jgi:hypothetical protein
MRGSGDNLEQWTAAFEEAARLLLAGRAPGPDADSYRIDLAPCTRHGPVCVCVTYGMFRSHYEWARNDPRRLAEQLVRTMLPGCR